ncbi:MAG: diacylglycerol kinase family protein [Candidatus Microsaccharimonas sp.]
MKNQYVESLVVISNPNSTRARSVEKDVVAPLRAEGVEIIRFATNHKDGDENVREMVEGLPEAERYIVATGDGTAEQAARALAIRRKSETASRNSNNPPVLALAPFGNYNDTASAHRRPGQSILEMAHKDVPTVDRTPLAFEINDNYLTHAFSYGTFGLTAMIASGFGHEKSRNLMRKVDPISRKALGYIQALRSYSEYKDEKLTDFRVDGGPVLSGRTDLAFSNNYRVAGIMRFPDTYYDKPYFGAKTDVDMATIRDIVLFGGASVFGHGSLDPAEKMRIEFEETVAELPFQAGGEFQMLTNVDSIFVWKDPSMKQRYVHLAAA